MIKKCLLFVLCALLAGKTAFSQDLEYLTLSDFDLKGKVKSCTVITDYGSEVFEFDESGMLIKSVTQYNEEDQDITLYTYVDGFLTERRMESYKNGQLDAATSMANFFEIDTTKNKTINEKVISYDKQFVENQIFKYDASDRLVGITISHLDAVDDTRVEYATYKTETTKTYFLNDIVQKSIRTSLKKKKDGSELKTVLTKEFLDGEPSRATEETFDSYARLMAKVLFHFDTITKQFAADEEFINVYDENGVLSKTIVKRGNAEFEKEYVFQFDDSLEKNWVKKIVTPDNSYTTRKIVYYPQEEMIQGSN